MRVKVTIKIGADPERTIGQLRSLGFDPQATFNPLGTAGGRDIFVIIPDDYDVDYKIGSLPDVVSVLPDEPTRKTNETGNK